VTAIRILVLAGGAAFGIIMPFNGVILASLGFEAGTIGFVLSLGSIAFALAVPAWGHVADVRFGRPRTLQVCGAGAAVALLALLGSWPQAVIVLLFAVFWIFQSGWQPLSDALTVNALGDQGHRYGPIRSLGSLSFAISVVAAGAVFQVAGYQWAFVFGAVAASSLVVVSAWIPDAGRADLAAHRRSMAKGATADPPSTASEPGSRSLGLGSAGVALRVAPRLGLILVAIALVHVALVATNSFLGLRLIELGGTPGDVGLAAGLSAITEIPAMMGVGWVVGRIGLRGLFAGSCILYAVCLGSWSVLTSPEIIIASRVLTGLGFAGVTVGVVLTIAVVLPPDLQATGQGLFQMSAYGITAFVTNVVGGLLFGSFGGSAVFAFGALAAVAGCIVGWFAFPRRVLPSELPPGDAIMAGT
jgi:PPP family 3-phenylpropionic acid transporter